MSMHFAQPPFVIVDHLLSIEAWSRRRLHTMEVKMAKRIGLEADVHGRFYSIFNADGRSDEEAGGRFKQAWILSGRGTCACP